MLRSLRSQHFQILVIGGGSVGGGVAMECASRGLRCGVVDENDWGSGTSARSTKLIHGGVRYLQDALLHLDSQKWDLVREGLVERSHMLKLAPLHITPISIAIPVYHSFPRLIYYYLGMLLYDIAALTNPHPELRRSYVLSVEESVRRMPLLKREGLRGTVVYSDAQHMDARVNLLLLLTSSSVNYLQYNDNLPNIGQQAPNSQNMRTDKNRQNNDENRQNKDKNRQNTDENNDKNRENTAQNRDNRPKNRENTQENFQQINENSQKTLAWTPTKIANYVQVLNLTTDPQTQKINGALVYDRIGKETFTITADVVINCTGPGADAIRKMSDPKAQSVMRPTKGTHVSVEGGKGDLGILVPNTTDNRVIFFLPWQGGYIAGTTERESTDIPVLPDKGDSDYILSQLSPYLLLPSPQIKSEWAGLRPLVEESALKKENGEKKGAEKKDAGRLARTHQIETDSNGLVSVMGGKWTSYRRIAQDAVDEVVRNRGWTPTMCVSTEIQVLGSHGGSWEVDMNAEGVDNKRWGKNDEKRGKNDEQSGRNDEKLTKNDEKSGTNDKKWDETGIQNIEKCKENDGTYQPPVKEERHGTYRKDVSQIKNKLINELINQYKIDTNTAQHLVSYYGYKATNLCDFARKNNNSARNLFQPISKNYPYMRGEILWAAQNEMAECGVDFLSHRLPLGMLDSQAAYAAAPQISELLAAAKNWGEKEKIQDLQFSMMKLQTVFGPPG